MIPAVRPEDAVTSLLREHAAVAGRMAESAGLVGQIARAAGLIAGALRAGSKVLLCGNGGSAADAQHTAAELVGRFARERAALPAVALTTDTSTLTALGNDYGFERIFSRQVEALGRPGDVLLGISTSGHSPNVLQALQTARRLKMSTLALTGRDGGALPGTCDLCLIVPAAETPRIQEAHITVLHIVCELVEAQLAG